MLPEDGHLGQLSGMEQRVLSGLRGMDGLHIRFAFVPTWSERMMGVGVAAGPGWAVAFLLVMGGWLKAARLDPKSGL